MIKTAKSLIGADKYQLMDYYNEHCFPLVAKDRKYRIQPDDDWCAMFTSVVAHMAGVVNFPYEVSVYYQAKLFGLVPEVADLVVYDWSGSGKRFDHVGVVVHVDDKYIKVVEGNYNDSIQTRVVKRNSNVVRGYIRVGDGRIDRLAKEVIGGAYGNGSKRKRLLGGEYLEVQKRVNELLD